MKYSLIQVLFLALAWSLNAADQILVDARLIEYPANESFVRKDWESGEFARRKGFEVLSAPKILVSSGQSAFLTVGSQHKIPNPLAAGQTNLSAGVELRILPNLNGNKIQFSAGLTLREHAGAQKEHGLDITEFVTHEYYVRGTVQQGQTVLFNPKSYKDNRKLAVVMTLTNLADKPLENQLDPASITMLSVDGCFSSAILAACNGIIKCGSGAWTSSRNSWSRWWPASGAANAVRGRPSMCRAC